MCEVVERKKLVDKREEEGYRIRVERFKDEEMLRTLNEHFERKLSKR